MTSFVKIKKGSYRGVAIKNKVFPLIKEFTFSATGDKHSGFVTVDGSAHPGFPSKKIRVTVARHTHVVDTCAEGNVIIAGQSKFQGKEETDEEIIARLDRRFNLMRKMTRGAMDNCIRSLIITGPAGIGKSYGVIEELRQSSLFDVIKHGENVNEDDVDFDDEDDDDNGQRHHKSKKRYDVVKGVTSGVGLYAKLWEYSDKGNVIVFDDCDDVLEEPECLNLLKAALDSGDKRTLHWGRDSSLLRAKGIEDRFDFNGSVIFITNIDMRADARGSAKKRAHIQALMSRAHYLDLTISTEHEKMLRIDSVYATGCLFKDHSVTAEQGKEVIAFMHENKARLNELSLRMAINLADLVAMGPEGDNEWKDDAELLCMS